MKLFKKIRKGFTLIELVVVIAVIAILSAVSVVSYVAITNRAKQSADEQAVRQMNTILAANSVMDLKSINDVYSAFAENDLSAENYKPLFKDRYFFWDSATNQIVYTDKNYVVIYPESLKGSTKGDHQWYSLTQSLAKVEIKATDKVTVDVGGVPTEKPVKEITEKTVGTKTVKEYNYAVETPEQLYTIGQEIKEAILGASSQQVTPTASGYEVVTTENAGSYVVGDINIDLAADLDLMGGAFNFCVKGNFTLNGHGKKIRGIVNNRDFVSGKSTMADGNAQTEKYGTGIVGYVAKNPKTGARGSAEFIDVTIENCLFGYSDGKGAALVGYASDSDLYFKNVVMDDCVAEAYEHSVGGFIGDVQQNVRVTLEGTNVVKNSVLKLHETRSVNEKGQTVAENAKECYGAGYFIGRQTGALLGDGSDATTNGKVQGSGTFSQSNNSKVFDKALKFAASKETTQKGYHYWDDAVLANRKNCDQ